MKKTIWIFLLIFSSLSMNAYAQFECFAGDKGGHYWTSTGQTQDRATAVAMSFCTAYSPDSASCQITKCAGN